MVKLAILVSGSGTNLQAIIDAIGEGKLNTEIVAVISDTENAYALERAKVAGISATFIPKGKNLSEKIMTHTKGADYIFLAGFLSILSKDFCEYWEGKILNIHPSLLPKYGGKGMYGMYVHNAVIANKEKESGATVHWVTEVIDGGSIIIQEKCTVDVADTAETLAEKVHKIEHKIVIEAIKKVIERKL